MFDAILSKWWIGIIIFYVVVALMGCRVKGGWSHSWKVWVASFGFPFVALFAAIVGICAIIYIAIGEIVKVGYKRYWHKLYDKGKAWIASYYKPLEFGRKLFLTGVVIFILLWIINGWGVESAPDGPIEVFLARQALYMVTIGAMLVISNAVTLLKIMAKDYDRQSNLKLARVNGRCEYCGMSFKEDEAIVGVGEGIFHASCYVEKIKQPKDLD